MTKASRPLVPLTPEQRDLAETAHHWTLALWRNWVKYYPWIEEELRTAALIGLMDAAAAYDRAMGFTFITLVAECVRRRLSQALAVSRRHCRRHRPHARLGEFDDMFTAPPDPDPFDGEMADVLYGSLDPDRADKLRRRVDGEYCRTIAADYGVSKQSVHNHTVDSLVALRDHPAVLAML